MTFGSEPAIKRGNIVVVVPTLGRRMDWLELSISAISAQIGETDSIVIVGPDEERIRALADRPRLRFEVETGSTLSEAINQGVRCLPETDYVAWIADDDVMAPSALPRSISRLDRSPSAPFSFGQIRYIDKEGKSKWLLRPGSWALKYARWGRNFIPQPGSVIRRSSWVAVNGLDHTLTNSMDQDLFLKLGRLGKPVYIPSELASFRVHAESISVIKNVASVDSEAALVRKLHQSDQPRILVQLARLVIPLTDRILLFVHKRIPGPPAPRINSTPYTEQTTRGSV